MQQVKMRRWQNKMQHITEWPAQKCKGGGMQVFCTSNLTSTDQVNDQDTYTSVRSGDLLSTH